MYKVEREHYTWSFFDGDMRLCYDPKIMPLENALPYMYVQIYCAVTFRSLLHFGGYQNSNSNPPIITSQYCIEPALYSPSLSITTEKGGAERVT